MLALRPGSDGVRKTGEGKVEKEMKHGQKTGIEVKRRIKVERMKNSEKADNILRKPEPTQRLLASNNANLTFVMTVP